MSMKHLQAEEGVSTTLFLVVLFALLSVALLAIDGGSLYVSRRGQVADTDAAALAATKALVSDPCATQSELDAVAVDYIDLNDAATELVGSVEVEATGISCPTRGTVKVTTERDAALFFAPLFGYDQVPTGVSTTVLFGPGAVFPGVRPIGICGLDPHYAVEWEPYVRDLRNGVDPAIAYANYETRIAIQDPVLDLEAALGESHPPYSGAAHVHRITFERSTTGGNPCGASPGNWGWLDFDSGGNQATCDTFTTEIDCGIAEGSDQSIDLSATDGPDCNVASGSINDCPDEPGGGGNSTHDALEKVRCTGDASTCEKLLFVVYDQVDRPGNYDLSSVVVVVLRGYEVGRGTPGPDNYFDLEFVDEVVEGTVGSSDPGGTAPPVFYLCGANDYTNC